MRRSIIKKILATIAVILIITDGSLLALGFSSVFTTVHNTYVSCARSSAIVAADLLDGVDLDRLQTDESSAKYYKMILEELCRTNDLEYLYVYSPDQGGKTITFILLACGEDSPPAAVAERTPGTVVAHELNTSELCAWGGGSTERVEETDNKYGHVMTAYSVVYDKNGEASALVGADVSMDEAFRIFFRRYRIMLAAVILSFIFVLAVSAAILKTRVLKPAEVISRRMKSFVTDRQSGVEKLEIKGNDEFAQMADSFNCMAEEIDCYIKNINALTEEKHRQEAEIQIARNIQSGFLPDRHYCGCSVKLEAVMIPAKYVGGDFYDYFCPAEDTICTVIADVSGKGVSAAMFMARAITVVRQYAQLGYSPSEILFHTNNALACNNPEQMFLTVFVGVYHSSTHHFVYANGGHNTPYLISGTVQGLDDAGGMVIGIFEDETYEEGEMTLQSGDTVFLYTDGVNEAVSGSREFFGTGRLERLLEKREQEQCVETVLEAVKNFARDMPQSDDITMLAFCVIPDLEIHVGAELENLPAVQNLILRNDKISAGLKNKLCLAVEEIFVNICSYAYGESSGDVEISLKVSDQIILRFCDGGRPFNPLEGRTDMEDYDIDTQIGGLGIGIVLAIADKAEYEYKNNKNILTIVTEHT